MTHYVIYCTKAKPNINGLNGHIVAEFDGETEEIINNGSSFRVGDIPHTNEVARMSCLDYVDLRKYLKDKNGYAIHIHNLKVFDRPLKLRELGLEQAPQNMCYGYLNGQRVVVISIRPEWVAKILNGEKTIEVRKTVLKECK